ncbi:MAG TPA: hypothetical protein VN898_12885, partial [Candidatus Binatia bacterium]|nr:hypothetical protein [Candidatus Binatia bacterium]
MNQSRHARMPLDPRRPLGRMLLAGLALILGAAVSPSREALAAPAAERAEGAKGVEERLTELEALVAKLRAEIQVLRDAMGGAPAAGSSAVMADLQKKVDALSLEIERLRIGEAAAPPAAGKGIAGFGPAASKVYGIKRGVSIGGYGEMLYQNFDPHADDGAPSG